ncbi:B12-binding domain-containing radical SAM protein [Nanoarchaeota archaeon]
MTRPQKIVLLSMPQEGMFVEWTQPSCYRPSGVKYMPLGLLSLATNLPSEGFEVKVFDPPSEGWDIKETISRIEAEEPDILGLSVVTQRVYAMKEILKRTSVPYTIVGGPHATHYPKQILEMGADAVFVGSLADLEFKNAVKTRPKGIIHCKTTLEEIKFPKRDFLNIETYFPKDFVFFKANKRLPMSTSNGCPHRCVFCNVQNKQLELKPASVVVDEMEYLKSIGANSIHILDDNFNIIETQVHKILDEMERRNFSIDEWSGRGQARMSEELARRLVSNKFKRLHVGIEALSDDILSFFNKSVRVKDIYQFCHTANKYNIDLIAYFILGTPLDTEEYWESLPKKIKELRIKHPYFNILFPAPDTGYYSQLLSNGTYSKDHWAEYMENPTPNYKIPYPYGKEWYEKTVNYANGLIKEFENKN